jgi:hypothetical protein
MALPPAPGYPEMQIVHHFSSNSPEAYWKDIVEFRLTFLESVEGYQRLPLNEAQTFQSEYVSRG